MLYSKVLFNPRSLLFFIDLFSQQNSMIAHQAAFR